MSYTQAAGGTHAPAAIPQATIDEQLRDRQRRIIRTDGSVEYIGSPLAFRDIHERIGIATADVVKLRHLGLPLVMMIVDDHGYETAPEWKGRVLNLKTTKALKPVNAIATALYHANCAPGTTHQIVGDVFVVPDDDFPD